MVIVGSCPGYSCGVRQIAPDHGGVIAGDDVVRAQYRLVRDLIVRRGGSLAPK